MLHHLFRRLFHRRRLSRNNYLSLCFGMVHLDLKHSYIVPLFLPLLNRDLLDRRFHNNRCLGYMVYRSFHCTYIIHMYRSLDHLDWYISLLVLDTLHYNLWFMSNHQDFRHMSLLGCLHMFDIDKHYYS